MFTVWKATPSKEGHAYQLIGKFHTRREANDARRIIHEDGNRTKTALLPLMYDANGKFMSGNWHN